MRKYLITYSLKTPNKDYTPFYNALKSMGPWWHHLESTWIIKSDLTPKEIYSRIGPGLLTVRDFILVVEIVPTNKEGFLPREAWDWINSD